MVRRAVGLRCRRRGGQKERKEREGGKKEEKKKKRFACAIFAFQSPYEAFNTSRKV